MLKAMKNVRLAFILLISFQLSGCGTILYPERRNQKPGRLDVGVTLLDACWLLVGIIPGIIAFAVDFSTGAIYLPESKYGSLDNDALRVVRFEPGTLTQEGLEEIIRKETGSDFSFADKKLKLSRVKTQEEVSAHFARMHF